jgi:hypothetical protein
MLKDKHINDWKRVKRARFNAAKRLERKQSAGIVTLAIVALQIQLADQRLSLP